MTSAHNPSSATDGHEAADTNGASSSSGFLSRFLALPAPRFDPDTGKPVNEHQLVSGRAVLVRLGSEMLPVCGTLLIFFVTQAITLAFVGHRLGTDLQAGFAIALSIFNVTGMSLCIGFVAGLDTLCSQAFGRDPTGRELPPIVHRGILVTLALCLPIILGFLYSKPLLVILFGHDLGSTASDFVQMMPGYLITNTVWNGVQRGLQAQQATRLSLVSSIAAVTTCPIANYYLTTEKHGMTGVAMAMTSANMVGAATVVVLALLHPASKVGTLPGSFCAADRRHGTVISRYVASVFSWSATRELFAVCVPALASICAEWWAFEFLLFTVTRYGVTVTDTFSIAVSIMLMLVSIPMGSGCAAGARLGNALGANEPAIAAAWQRIAFAVNASIAVIDATLLFFFGHRLLELYSEDPKVQAMFRSGLGSVMFMHTLDCFQTACQNTFRGAGEQAPAARFSLMSLWLVGLPASVLCTHSVTRHYQFAAAIAGFALGLLVTISLCVWHARSWDWVAKAEAASASRDDGKGDEDDEEAARILQKSATGETDESYGATKSRNDTSA